MSRTMSKYAPANDAQVRPGGPGGDIKICLDYGQSCGQTARCMNENKSREYMLHGSGMPRPTAKLEYCSIHTIVKGSNVYGNSHIRSTLLLDL
jgi:hypothetical protein